MSLAVVCLTEASVWQVKQYVVVLLFTVLSVYFVFFSPALLLPVSCHQQSMKYFLHRTHTYILSIQLPISFQFATSKNSPTSSLSDMSLMYLPSGSGRDSDTTWHTFHFTSRQSISWPEAFAVFSVGCRNNGRLRDSCAKFCVKFQPGLLMSVRPEGVVQKEFGKVPQVGNQHSREPKFICEIYRYGFNNELQLLTPQMW